MQRQTRIARFFDARRKYGNVAVYGMITLRTDGEKVVLAQKLEVPGGNDKKWDIHELHYNQNLGEFKYVH